MPRLTTSHPKYRFHKASGQAVVTINGRDHYLGPHGTKASHRKYDKLIEKWLKSDRSVSFGLSQHTVTILELVVSYLEHAKKLYGSTVRTEYDNMLHALRPLRNLYGSMPVGEFKPKHLKNVRDTIIESGRRIWYGDGAPFKRHV